MKYCIRFAPNLLKCLLAAAMLLAICGWAIPQTASAADHPILYLFWGDGCPHCHDEKEFLKDFPQKYPEVEMRWFEIWNHKEFALLAEAMRQQYKITAASVPITLIGRWSLVGYSDAEKSGREIEAQVVDCIKNGCVDALATLGPRQAVWLVQEQAAKRAPLGWELFPATIAPRKDMTFNVALPAPHTTPAPSSSANAPEENTADVPLFGKISADKLGMPLFTLVIAGLDGFNPCAMWVLSFLLTLVIHAHSRKKILLIGSIFVIASGVIYFIFMVGWLNLYQISILKRYGNYLRIAVALIAIVMGAINCKDFFFFKRGISLTIPESAMPNLFKKMRKIVNAPTLSAMNDSKFMLALRLTAQQHNLIGLFVLSLLKLFQISPLIGSTIVLAVTANLIEFGCTLGLPAIFTNILAQQKFSAFQQYFYLTVYNVIYVVPLAAIVGVFAWKMGGRKLTEKEGRILKLVGGLLMLTLGMILLIKPELLTFA